MQPLPKLPLDPTEIGETLTDEQTSAAVASAIILYHYVALQAKRCGVAK